MSCSASDPAHAVKEIIEDEKRKLTARQRETIRLLTQDTTTRKRKKR